MVERVRGMACALGLTSGKLKGVHELGIVTRIALGTGSSAKQPSLSSAISFPGSFGYYR